MQTQFEGLKQSLLRLPDVIKSIPDVVRNPVANPLAAVILLGAVSIIALIILLSVALIIMRPSVEDEYLFGGTSDKDSDVAAADKRRRPLSWLTVSSVVILLFAAVWVTAGFTTSAADVCSSCHSNSAHASSRAEDQHSHVSCVDCHESGGTLAQVTVNLVPRVAHVVLARMNPKRATGFGIPVASDGCLRCHRDQIAMPTVSVALGVKMSHAQPLEAGARCVECHALSSGVVGTRTVGMTPCLRCHDGKAASAQCSKCHVGDPSNAIQARISADSMAAAQVPNPQCGGCHTNMTKCNACHGIQMPHSTAFKQFAHARAAAVSIWKDGGKQCARCHYVGHNNCQRLGCHSGLFPSHPPVWRTMHASAPWNGPKTACSCHNWNPWEHNGMTYCEICHPVKPKNAR